MFTVLKKNNEQMAMKYTTCQILLSRIFSNVIKMEEKADPMKLSEKPNINS